MMEICWASGIDLGRHRDRARVFEPGLPQPSELGHGPYLHWGSLQLCFRNSGAQTQRLADGRGPGDGDRSKALSAVPVDEFRASTAC